MADDTRLAGELAELARQFILWLQENELHGIPGLKGQTFDLFEFYAGVFQRYSGNRYTVSPAFLKEAPQAERDRFARFSLGVRNLLLITNPLEEAAVIDGVPVTPNRIMRTPGFDMKQAGALYVESPRLGSIRLDDSALALYATTDFSAIRHRMDLVWDDRRAAERGKFKYLSIFDQHTVPRAGFEQNVGDVPVPEDIVFQANDDLRLNNNGAAIVERRTRAYRQYLLNRCTYGKRGNYFRKWEQNPARDAEGRRFQPTNLTDTYLMANFLRNEPKIGDDLLLVDLGGWAFFLYRLYWDPEKGRSDAKFKVDFQINGISELVRSWPPPKSKLRDSHITAVVFRALSGGRRRPNQTEIVELSRSAVAERFVVDYRAYVDSYYGDQITNRGMPDEVYFDRFVRTYFPDKTYTIRLMPGHNIDRDDLFLNALRQEEKETPAGPLREPLTRLRQWCEADENNFVFTQGAKMGQGDSEIIGINPAETEIFEWNPKTGLVTRTLIRPWLDQYVMGKYAREVYASTAGVLPLVGVMFCAALVIPVTLVALPALSTITLGSLARSAVVKKIKDEVEKKASRAAIRKLTPQLRVMALELVLRFLPDSQHPLYRFFRGIVSGFGSGALDHWLGEFDDRLKRQIPRIPHVLVYAASPATYRTYQVYVVLDKLTAAATRVSALHDALKAVWTDEIPQQVAAQLRKFSKGLAIAFLILLVVALYFHELSDSNTETQRLKAKTWVKRQQETLQVIVQETSSELTRYANKLRALIAKARSRGVDPGAVQTDKELAEELRAADDELSDAIKGKLGSMAGKLTGAADLLALVFEHLGIESWQELQDLGFMQLLAKGADALADMPALSGESIERLAEGLGELISTLMLEKALVPENVKKTSGLLFGRPTSKAHKGVVAGGTPRAILAFLIHPFEDLTRLPAILQAALEKSKPAGFSHYNPDLKPAQAFAHELLKHDGSLSHRLMLMAEDEKLLLELQLLAASAASRPPPAFKDLGADAADWPANAIAFVLFSWIRVAVREFGAMIKVLEDRTPFKDGKLNLATLLEVVGLDVAMDDPTVEALRDRFASALKQP